MLKMLQRLNRQAPGTRFIQEILGKCTAGEPTLVPSIQHLPESLTVREDEVLQLLARRLRDKEIALELGVSTETVKSHLKSMYRKLGVNKRMDAVYKAREFRLITSE